LAFLEEGEVQQGQEALEIALALVNDRQLRLTLLGDYITFLASQNQWAKGLKQAREALRLVPNDPGWLATQEQAQSQLAKASPVQSKPQPPVQTRNKETSPVPQKTKEQWLDDGTSHYNAKEYQKALTDYDRAIQLDPQDADAYYNRGLVYYNLKEYQKAIADYDRALQLNPQHVGAYYNRGLVYDDLKEYQKAISDYDRVIQLAPQDADTYNNRGNAYRELKEYQKAISDYDRALQRAPNYTLAKDNRELAYRLLRGKS